MPPVNDDFANRITLVGSSGSESFDGTGATFQGSEPPTYYWDGAFGDTLWYEWVATATGYFRFDTEGSDGGGALAIYTGSAIGSLTPVARMDDSYRDLTFQYPAICGFLATNGVSYKIQVRADGSTAGILRWQDFTPPVNDAFASALDLTDDNLRIDVPVNNIGCSTQGSEPDADSEFDVLVGQSPGTTNSGRSIWFKYDNSANVFGVQFHLQMKDAEGNEVMMAVWKGTTIGGLTLATIDKARTGWDDFAKGDYAVDIWDYANPGDWDNIVVTVAPGETLYVQLSGVTFDFGPDPTLADLTQWVATLNYRGQKIFYVDPTDDPGPARGSLVVTAGVSIEDKQTFLQTAPTSGVVTSPAEALSDIPASFLIQGGNIPDDGPYLIRLKYRIGGHTGTSASTQTFGAVVRVNGLIHAVESSFAVVQSHAVVNATEAYFILNGPPIRAEDYTSGNTTVDQAGRGAEYFGMKSGDVIEVCLFTNNQGANPRWLKIVSCELMQVSVGGGPGGTLDLAEVPELPLGATDWTTTGSAGAELRQSRSSQQVTKDICVTSNGDVYVVVVESVSTTYYVGVKKWNGSSWSTITTDLSGHGAPIAGGRIPSFACAIDTDGTDVFIVWGEKDGTNLSGTPNWRWRCKKWNGSTLTELGSSSGQANDTTRTLFANDAGTYETGLQCKCGPDGTLWVGFAESEDTSASPFPTCRAYLWYWNGSAWVDSLLPDPPGFTSDVFIVNEINVDPQWQLDFTFCNHLGTSDWPSAIYQAAYWDSPSTFIGREFVYQEYDGATWTNDLSFDVNDIFPPNTGEVLDSQEYLKNPLVHQGAGHWQQGISLFDDGRNVLFACASGNAPDRVLMMRMEQDGTTFTAWPSTYEQPDYLSRNDELRPDFDYTPPVSAFGGWIDPTGADALCDPEGRIWMIYDPFCFQYATMLVRMGEVGNGYGWTFGSKLNNPIGGQHDSVGFSRFVHHGGSLYVTVFSTWNTVGTLGVWLAPITDSYEAFTSTPAVDIEASGIVIALENTPYDVGQTWVRVDDPAA